MPSRTVLIFAVAVGLLPATASRLETGRAAPGADRQARMAEAYGKLPLSFERNLGQADPRVQYLSRARGYTLFLTRSEAVLSLRASAEESPSVVRMTLLGANPSPDAAGQDEMPTRTHYLIGNDPARWHTDVPHYARVRYAGVYPGVDLVYHGGRGRLEYDFVVAPGSDPGPIRLRLEGAEAARLDDAGNLVLETSAGRVVQEAPLVYQDVDGERRAVDGRYAQDESGEVGFELGEYDASRALVIDPVLEYSTYLGGSFVDGANAIAIDGSGSAYVTGTTVSTDFPTQGPVEGDQGGQDVFVSKLSPSGSTLEYSTYLGGAATDYAEAIAVDRSGSAYVTGSTLSTDFPTAAAYQTDQAGEDAFVVKLSPGGSSLAYSTYLGGDDVDGGFGVAVDALGQAYVAGETASADFPTLNTYQTDQPGYDVFVTKLAASGSTLVYSSLVGGNSYDTARAVAVDASGSAYVTGYTYSMDFPTVGPAQGDRGGVDAFVAKLAPPGSSLGYSTYLGGAGSDFAYSIAVDGAGSAYVAGATDSTDFPVSGPYQSDQGGWDAFVTKLSASGSSFAYSTYLGGGLDDLAQAVAVDAAGSAHVTGSTSSTDFPTAHEYQLDAPGEDAFVARLAPSGSSLVYSTYLGGNGGESGNGVAADGGGSTYVAGDTGSTDFPTANPFQTDQGGVDGFVAKLALPTSQSFYTLAPCRVVDTRNAVSALGGPPLACSPTPVARTFPLAGACDIPATARAISYNVTVTEATSSGHLRLFPAASLLPAISSINFVAGQTRANNGVVLLGTGNLNVTCHPASGTAHVIVDVNGYFEETPDF